MIRMEPTMRWFGPADPVGLATIRQAGCTGVVTALHQIPVGEVWPVDAIRARQLEVEAAGMTWTVIESLPVSDDIKRQSGDWRRHIEAYQESLRNVAACGLEVVTYNFMPVLDWVRTDVAYRLPNGAEALRFERAAFIAFDLFLLKRPSAEDDYTPEEIELATARFEAMTEAERETLSSTVRLGLPGGGDAFTMEYLLSELATYDGIDHATLQLHLIQFLEEVVPVAQEVGVRLAIHPDDPPYPVLGLPRVVSTQADLQALLDAVASPSNGLCFCTGSLGARPDNDVLAMLEAFGERIHFLHLRNTTRQPDGVFFEAAHLEGDTDLAAVVEAVLELATRTGRRLPMRPDHGPRMLDDLRGDFYPGYSAIGRLKALAELRGLEAGLLHRTSS
ncbi:MAG: mannonate dehydratase [Rubricoccaceae bacterium]